MLRTFLQKSVSCILILLLCASLFGGIGAFALKGDITGDQLVSIQDVTALLLYLANPNAPVSRENLDVNADTIISIQDVTALLQILADPINPSVDLEYDEEIDLSTLTDGQTLTLSSGGNYLVTGTAANARILINNKNDDFNLLLYNASITFLGEGAAIQADKCNNCTLTMVAGTENFIADSSENTEDAALQVKSGDLKLKGAGKLTINSKTEGIYNTKDLKLDGPTVNVTSKDHGVVVKKTITVNSGSLTVNAKGDGLKAKGDVEDDGVTHKAGTGVVTVNGGVVNITATKDGFDCEEGVVIAGGNTTVHSNGDGVKAADSISISGGIMSIYAGEDGIKTTVGALDITGGDIYVESTGDGINAETDLSVSGTPVLDVTAGGGHSVTAGETSCDGLKALGNITIEGGNITLDSAMYGLYAKGNITATVNMTVTFGNGYSKYFAGGSARL